MISQRLAHPRPAWWMGARAVATELWRRDVVLTVSGAAHLLVAVPMLLGLATDQRMILSLNPWVKPLKFALSIAAFLLWMAWLSGDLRPARRRVTSLGIASAMSIETICIALQSLRGRTSHYNVATPFDLVVWSTMSAAILVNTAMVVVVLAEYGRPRQHPRVAALPRPYLAGVRYGLVLFLLGGLEGFLMVRIGRHTVGAPDGGPGLPILNWSTAAGDLRVTHFLLLHALQLLPLVGYGIHLAARRYTLSIGRQVLLVRTVGIMFLGLAAFTLLRSLAGRPLFAG
jgi:hypothetical protein